MEMETADAAKRRRHRNERIAATILCVALAAGTWVLHVYNVQMDAERDSHQEYIPRPEIITPEVRLLQDYIRIDTTNPPGNELAAAQWLRERLREGGVEPEIIESAPGRANLYARIRGKQRGGGLLLMHHMDVVPATGAWTRAPFRAEILMNELYGRGALDMKGVGICFLRAFLDVAHSGKQPEHDLVFLAVADEESGGKLGTGWLVEHRPDLFEGIEYSLNEGGITETTREKLVYFGVEIGTKTFTKVEVTGPSRESLESTRIALEPYFESDEPTRVLPEVARFAREIAGGRMQYKPYLQDLPAMVTGGEFWKLPVNYRELTQNLVFAKAPEQVDGRWKMDTWLFNLPDEDAEKRLGWLRGVIAPFGATVGAIEREDPPQLFSSEATPMFALIRASVRTQYGEVPFGSEILNQWTNDSRFLRRRGVQAYGIAPFPVSAFQTDTIHRSDERIRLDWFMQGVGLTRKIVEGWCFRS